MTTLFGKEMKKLRIDLGVTLMDFSKMLSLSPAFLSAIETGKKRIPDNFLELLASQVPAVANNRDNFEVLINQARNEVRVALDHGNLEDVRLATAFARRFSDLSDDDKDKLKAIFGGAGGEQS